MATASTIGIATGGGGAVAGAMQGLSASGSYILDAKDRGMTEDQCKLYGAIMGTIEGATGALTFGNTKVVGKTIGKLLKGGGVQGAKNIAKQAGKEIAKKEALRTGSKALFVGSMEEGFQEGITEPIQELMAGWIGGQDKTNWENMPSRIFWAAAGGAFSSVIVGGAGINVHSCIEINNKMSNGETVTQQELVKAYKDASKKLDTKKIMDDTVKQYQTIIQNQNAEQQNQVENQNNINTQQIIQAQNNLSQNGISEQIDILPAQKYIYEKSDNIKIDNLRKDASKYWTNTVKTKNYVNMLEKIIQDKDIDIRLDANLKDSKGNIANGKYENGVITINPNSTRAGEFIAIHELTHAIGTDQMRNIVQKYRESNAEFNKAVESLLQNYNTTELTDEALADVAGQLFGNQEYINNLAQTQPSLFKRIYNEIKYLWHQFTGYKNQDQFINDLQYKWEQAYRSNNKLNDTTNYYIEPVAKFNEIEYNNAIEEKLGKREYAILRSIINSDSNIKPGINYVEVTNGRYTVYYKGFDDFKVMSRKVDADAGRINKRNDATGRKTRYSKTFEQSIGNEGTTASNDEISNFNTTGTRERSGSNSSSSKNIENGVNIPTQESENNSGSFNLSKNKQTRLDELKAIDTSNMGFIERGKIKTEIRALEQGYNSIEEYKQAEQEKAKQAKEEYEQRQKARENEKKQNQVQLEKYIKESTPLQNAQFKIIQNTNPMLDDYHTGIRSPKDIKTFDEVINDEESFTWGDFSKEDAKQALKKGKITIYSSYPIENGTFVSTSKVQAEEYAGGKGNKVYSKIVPLEEIAWINGDEGQYANIKEKYSLPTKEWQEYLEDNYKATGTRTNLEEIKLPIKKDKLPRKNIKDSQELDTSSSINLPKKQEELISNKKTSNTLDLPEGKNRKHYKSIMQSQYTTDEAKAIAKELMKTDTYIPESNEKQLERADERISISGADSELNSLMSRSMTGGNIKADDIAVGERLIQYYSKIGDKTKLQEAIQATAMAGTTAGQTVQAMSLLNHQTPQGHAVWLQRTVEKMNNDLLKMKGAKVVKDDNGNISKIVNNKGKDITKEIEIFELTPEMIEKIVNSKNTQELQDNLNEVYSQLGQQVSKSTMQKIDSWRYFSMLANTRTHIRNIVGNASMGSTQTVKNKVAGIIEGFVSKVNPNIERTHTIVPASSKVKEFAKNDIVNVADRLGLNENKYNPKNRIANNMRTFKSDILEKTVGKAFSLNDKALEAEDGWGLKAGYKRALAEYMTANKLTPENITDTQLGKARNYAVKQAKEATFHQECQLATLINQLANRNKFAKYTTDAILPFVKTPINVAKAGMEYSPVGLAKSMVYDTTQLRKGNININQYIDNISKGLTGTGIALVGYVLADAGILKASGSDDDKKEDYEEYQGKQTYSIQIGDNTYSLDWLSPTGIPLFIGAEISEMSKAKVEEKTSLSSDSDSTYNQILESGTNLLNAMANAMNPMTEMSMLSGLTSALSSYEQDSAQMIASIGTNAVKSYVNQFVPTTLGQIAKSTDEYERSTTSTKSGVLPRTIDSTKNQIMSKIPGLRQMLPTKTDIWGNDLKQNEGQDIATQVLDKTISETGRKFVENAIFPWTRKEISSNNVDKELTDLYALTGESSVLPSTLDKTLTIDGQTYRMTSEEYANYKKQYGKTAFSTFSNIVRTDDYKNLSDETKQEIIENIYSYSKEVVKKDYAEKNNLEYEPSTMMKTINSIEESGGNINAYFKYKGAVSLLKSQKIASGELKEGQSVENTDKMQVLVDSNYSNKEKSAIFENCILSSSEDSYYTVALKDSTININEYLQYKIKEANNEFSADKDKYGNSISGTSKKKYYNYINKNITGYNNRLLLLAQKYKLSNNERQNLTEYINENYEGQDRIDVFKKLSTNYKVTADNKIYYK